jgi:hypothetical protein
MRQSILTLSLAAIASLAGVSHADTLFDNLKEGSTPPYNTGSSFTVIQKGAANNLGNDTETAVFFSPSKDAFLTSLTIPFAENNSPPDSNLFNFTLRADDNSGLPGTAIESWNNVAVTNALGTPGEVILTSLLNPHLLHIEEYWIVASAANDTSDGGWYPNSTQAAGNSSPDGYVQLQNDGTPFPGGPPAIHTDENGPAYKVEGSLSLTQSVPAPAAALAGIPLLSLVAISSLRKRRTSAQQ